MIEVKKVHTLIESINTYYAFALLLYSALLFVLSYTDVFFWAFLVMTPLLAAWGGYLFRSYLQQRNQRYGFYLVTDAMTYEIKQNHRYTLRYNTVIKAATNQLMIYPIGYQWSGAGEEEVPKISSEGHTLLSSANTRKSRTHRIAPHKASSSLMGEWHYWFVSLNPPLHKGDLAEIKYSQDFNDKKKLARPYLRYFVRIPMQRLELNIKFPANDLPKEVTGGFFKPSDPARFRVKSGVRYDADKHWATWVIEKPKRGYCYQINWQ